MSFLRELFAFIRARRKFWLIPIFAVMLVLGGLVVLTKGQRWRRSSILCSEGALLRILGISAFYHDSAAASSSTARLWPRPRKSASRAKNTIQLSRLRHSLLPCRGEDRAGELDHVVFYEKPFLKFERLLETYLAFAPRGFQSFRKAIPIWLKEKLFQKGVLRDHLGEIDEASIGMQGCCSRIITRATRHRRSLPRRT